MVDINKCNIKGTVNSKCFKSLVFAKTITDVINNNWPNKFNINLLLINKIIPKIDNKRNKFSIESNINSSVKEKIWSIDTPITPKKGKLTCGVGIQIKKYNKRDKYFKLIPYILFIFFNRLNKRLSMINRNIW